MASDEAAQSVRRDVDGLVAEARKQLGEAGGSLLVARLVGIGKLRKAGNADDYSALLDWTGSTLRTLRTITEILEHLQTQAYEHEEELARSQGMGDVWWNRRRRQIDDAYATSPSAGEDLWHRTYAEVIAEWALPMLDRLLETSWLHRLDQGLAYLFRTGTGALVARRYADALPMLQHLAGRAREVGAQPYVEGALLTLVGRIQLYDLFDTAGATRSFQAGVDADSAGGLPRAGMGAACRSIADLETARRWYMEAIERSPLQHDGYVGMGLLCEDLGAWDQSEDWYDKAVSASPDVKVLEALRAPTPGNLFWEFARNRRRARDLEGAVAGFARALDEGIRGDDDFPERAAYKDLGKVLAKLDRSRDAADAFFEAGRRYSWCNDEKEAVKWLQRSVDLDPGAGAYWHLAESLRVLSYRPDPPYIDEEGNEQVRQSLAAWERGMELGRPDANWAWVFVTRALLNEQRSKLVDETESLWWESAMYLERGLLLDRNVIELWPFLGRQHRTLGCKQTSRHAVEQALKLDPTHLGALEEMFLTLAALGAHEEALNAADRLLTLGNTPWIQYARSAALLSAGDAQGALDEIDRVLEEGQFAYYHLHRARCLETLDRIDEAREEYEWVLDHTDPVFTAFDHPTNRGWAAYRLQDPDKAIRIYEEVIDSGAMPRALLRRDLGLFYLAKGDLVRGEDALRTGVDELEDPYDLTLLECDLDQFERTAGDIDPSPVGAVVGRVRKLVRDRRTAIESLDRTPLGELSRAFETMSREVEGLSPTSPALIALRAGIARLAADESDWLTSADHYRALVDTGLPEAATGLQLAVGRLREGVDEAFRAADNPDCSSRYESLVALASVDLGESEKLIDSLRVRAAIAAFGQDSTEQAQRHIEAVAADDLGELLAEAIHALIEDPVRYWALDRHLAELIEEDPDAAYCEGIVAVRSVSGQFFDAYFRSRVQDMEASLSPLVSPVRFELGSGLLSETDTRLLTRTALPAMRRRIKGETGVEVPAIRISANASLEGHGYAISVHGIKIDHGVTHAGMVFVDGGAHEAGPNDGLGADDATPGRNPATGKAGHWSDPRLFGTDHEPTPRAPIDYAMRHLEAVLRRNLVSFLTVEEVEAWVHRWTKRIDPALATLVEADRGSHLRLAGVLRGLVRESVPVTEDTAAVILEVMSAGWPELTDVFHLTRTIRMRLRTRLPGRDRTPVPLPDWFVSRIAGWVRVDEHGAACLIPRAEAEALQLRVEQWLIAERISPSDVVFLTSNAEVRSFLWRFLSSKYVSAVVLSEEEVRERANGIEWPEVQAAHESSHGAAR